jgi:hypothetical protein
VSKLLQNVKKRNPKDNISLVVICPNEYKTKKNYIGKFKAAVF